VRRTTSVAAWVAVLVWCGVCGWFAFVRSTRVPLVSLADLGFHELGHLLMYVLPINETLTAAMGSIMQCAVPLGLAAYFAWWRKEPVAMVACLAWAATNFQDVSVYAADAPTQALQLLGGKHDWAHILGPDGFDAMDRAAGVASAIRGIGVLVLLAATGVAVSALWGAFNAARTRGPDLRVATGATPDDRWPTTSRTPSSDPSHRSTRW
jgi:hypothetical protein